MICDIHGQWGPTTAAPSWNQPDHVKGQLLQRGISMGCFASALARRYDMVAGNDAVYEAAKSKGGGVVLKGWLVIQPNQHDESANLMRKYMFHDNFVGAALYPNPATGEPVTLARCQDLLTVFRRYGKALLIHTPTAAAMHHAVDIASFLGAGKVIASGMGGVEWREAIDYAVRPTNLFLDFSGALTSDKIAFAIQRLGGCRKLVFGSGSPSTDPAAVLALLDELDLTDDERHRILYGNAHRIFGELLGPDEESTAGGGLTLTPMGG